jgi:hypothetical protein
MYYECMKWNSEWFEEIWCKNHWNWSCGCKDIEQRSYRDLFGISGKWLGLNWNLFSKTRGLLGICGQRLDLWQGQGPFCKDGWNYWFWNYFPIENHVDSVHGSWTSAGCGPCWTGHHGRPWSSSELGLAAALSHGGLPRGGDNEEGTTRIRFCLLPRLERQRGGSAPVVELWLQAAAVRTWQRKGTGWTGAWRASLRSGRPFIGAGGEARGWGCLQWPAMNGV